jgi:hypothetical protein
MTIIYPHFSKELVHLATCTVFNFAQFAVVFVTQEIIPEERVMRKALEDDIQEASLTKVQKTSATFDIHMTLT